METVSTQAQQLRSATPHSVQPWRALAVDCLAPLTLRADLAGLLLGGLQVLCKLFGRASNMVYLGSWYDARAIQVLWKSLQAILEALTFDDSWTIHTA